MCLPLWLIIWEQAVSHGKMNFRWHSSSPFLIRLEQHHPDLWNRQTLLQHKIKKALKQIAFCSSCSWIGSNSYSTFSEKSWDNHTAEDCFWLVQFFSSKQAKQNISSHRSLCHISTLMGKTRQHKSIKHPGACSVHGEGLQQPKL